ncbi:MAG: hypothetical protein N4A68_20270 [Maledivibacter sp.]|jgi:hypothetical protein|nr:hypothetical protein [Maledivibacter sp.]
MPIDGIANNSEISNHINILNLDFSKPQVSHLNNLVAGIINIESKRNISNLSKKFLSGKYRSSVTRFLNNTPWDG